MVALRPRRRIQGGAEWRRRSPPVPRYATALRLAERSWIFLEPWRTLGGRRVPPTESLHRTSCAVWGIDERNPPPTPHPSSARTVSGFGRGGIRGALRLKKRERVSGACPPGPGPHFYRGLLMEDSASGEAFNGRVTLSGAKWAFNAHVVSTGREVQSCHSDEFDVHTPESDQGNIPLHGNFASPGHAGHRRTCTAAAIAIIVRGRRVGGKYEKT